MEKNAGINANARGGSNVTANGDENGPRGVLTTALHDPSVTFEEYFYYAQLSRAHQSEASAAPSTAFTHGISEYLPFTKRTVAVGNDTSGEEKDGDGFPVGRPWNNVSDEEYVQASRALRTATWGAVFYLITTDILGPFTTAYVLRPAGLQAHRRLTFRQMGVQPDGLRASGGALLHLRLLRGIVRPPSSMDH
ncbi:MAG: hypothetical protein Q9170_001655 [Blastenia crenularia]